MFILSSICSSLKVWSVNHTAVYENSELKILNNIKALDETSNNWPNYLFGINTYKVFESC